MTAESLSVHLDTCGTVGDAAATVGFIGPAARIIDAKGATAAQVSAIMSDMTDSLSHYETELGLRAPLTMTLFCASAPH